MTTRLSPRLIVEVGLSALCAVLVPVTAVWPDWIEAVFGVDPDHHSGEAEWGIVLALLAAAVVCGVLARREWLSLQRA